MDASSFREAAAAAVEQIITYYNSLPSLRVTPSIKPGYLAPLLPPSPPSDPTPFREISSDIDAKILPGVTHWNSPNFMAFFPAHSTYASMLAELYSAAFNAPAFNWVCSPACTELETAMMDWLVELLALPPHFLSSTGVGGGVIQGSASEGVVAVMVAARDRAVREQLTAEGLLEKPDESPEERLRREDRAADLRGKLVALVGDGAHSSTQKAASICGVRWRSVAAGRSTSFRLTGDAVRDKLREVQRQGLVPFYVTATLGTTGTCAVDDFAGIVDACEGECGAGKVWVHVDAAYAGSALVCEEFRGYAAGIERADSFLFNMHKWMLTNFDASCLFLKDRRPLIAAMSISPSYLLNPTNLTGRVTDYRDWQIPLGRRFRALKIWFVLRLYGASAIQAMIRKHVALGELFAGLVREKQGCFEILAGPQFALTVIRCKGKDGMGDNEVTRKVYEEINAEGEFFLTSAVLEGVYAIRVQTASNGVTEKSVRRVAELLVEKTRALQ